MQLRKLVSSALVVGAFVAMFRDFFAIVHDFHVLDGFGRGAGHRFVCCK